MPRSVTREGERWSKLRPRSGGAGVECLRVEQIRASPGDNVKRGQVIGLLGATGRADVAGAVADLRNTHLHFELAPSGPAGTTGHENDTAPADVLQALPKTVDEARAGAQSA
jgi:murein DD-endopeptidase MepM/ murein hydrolase activator NlpD